MFIMFVIFSFSGRLGLSSGPFVWEQSFAQPLARRLEGCRFYHYLS